ncbi:MAG: hypothetical protein DI585_02390 [Pseudomonas fluorescens]|nr:MAG: hypothetical protein DI585_02390 [Pseudomonas fluorescens]
MAELSKQNITVLRSKLADINANAGTEPEAIDFATAMEIIAELRRRNRPMPQYMIHLSENSEAGQAFRKAYRAAREAYPDLPKLIGWRGKDEDSSVYTPTYERRFGKGQSMVGRKDDEGLMTMDARPDEVEHDE